MFVYLRALLVITACCDGRIGLLDGIVKLLFQYSLLTVTDFKFDKHVSRDTPDMTPLKFSKRGRGQGCMTPTFWGVKC